MKFGSSLKFKHKNVPPEVRELYLISLSSEYWMQRKITHCFGVYFPEPLLLCFSLPLSLKHRLPTHTYAETAFLQTEAHLLGHLTWLYLGNGSREPGVSCSNQAVAAGAQAAYLPLTVEGKLYLIPSLNKFIL